MSDTIFSNDNNLWDKMDQSSGDSTVEPWKTRYWVCFGQMDLPLLNCFSDYDYDYIQILIKTSITFYYLKFY